MSNPISVLFEYCTDKGIQGPVFNLASRTGESHNPLFVFEITIETLNVKAEGSGSSKQKAKHAAAKALLDTLQASQPSDEATLNGMDVVPVPNTTALACRKNVVAQDINAIGMLQEMCVTKNWPPPRYNDVSVEGPPHLRTFTISCQIANLVQNGFGSTKKHARHQSAQKMLEQLELLGDLNTKAIHDVFDGNIDGPKLMLQAPREKRVVESEVEVMKTMVEDVTVNVSKVEIKDEVDNDDEGLARTTNENFSLDEAIEKLNDVMKEYKLTISYYDIEKKSFEGKLQCLVKLGTSPVAVCFGTGETDLLARQAAAYDALLYLDFMTDCKIF